MHLVSLLSGRIARLGRHAEPADPLRRRPDEPRLLRDDEPGRPRRHDQGRARGGQRPDRPGLRGRRRQPRRHSRPRLRRQSGHAPPLPRHRSDRTWRRALRACRFRRGRSARRRDIGIKAQCRRAHLYAALHRRPCRRGCRRRDALRRSVPPGRHDAAGRCRHQCRDRARQSRTAPSPAPRPPARPSRARKSPSGQRAAPGAIERVRIDPDTLEPSYRVIGIGAVVRRSRASPKRYRRPASPAFAARASSRLSPRCSSPASSPRTA